MFQQEAQQTVTAVTDPIDAVAESVAKWGVSGRRLRLAVAMLTDGARTLEEVVRDCALPRRAVEALLRDAGPDLDQTADGFMVRQDRVAAYRERFGYAQLRATEPSDPQAERLKACADLVTRIAGDIAAAPTAKAALDHVSACAETVVRRALWLDATFDLSGARLLCVGDHDLTSLAVCAVNPGLAVTVVDADERLLEFIETRAATRGYDVRCLYADFRFGIPETVLESSDVVLTDPPYTPQGVQLFLGRGLQGLRDKANGRLVMAYGFSPLHPALGVKVQQAVTDLGLAFEAILPAFNRYHGAQAVGSASDLYVCRPTARTWQVLARTVLARTLSDTAVNIYTHGSQSLEGKASTVDKSVAGAVLAHATGTPEGTPALLAGAGWPLSAEVVTVADLLTSGVPASVARTRPLHAAVNLADDPGPWLLRTLLAVDADRLAILVPNNHADLANEAAQRALTSLVAPKYSLRLLRSTPSPRHAVVVAEAAAPADSPVANRLLSRAHGKIGNIWREGLIRLSRDRLDGPLTKNAARAAISAAVTQSSWLEERLIDLPRHAIRTLLADTDAKTSC
jgi:hypothetical protein